MGGGGGRRHHSRTRSTGHSGSTLSLNSSSSYHKFCNHSSPVATPKFGRHEFCIGLGANGSSGGSTSNLHSSSSHSAGRMVRHTGAGSLSKPNSPIPARKSALARGENSDTSDNSPPTSHMSSSSSSTAAAAAAAAVKGGKGKGRGTSFTQVGSLNGLGSSGGCGGGYGERRSVHKQNLYVVSFPIILLFNIFRSLLYQIFLLLRYVYCTAVQRRQYYAELQRQRRTAQEEEEQKLQQRVESGGGGGGDTTVTELVETSTAIINNNIIVDGADGSECAESEALIMNSPRFPPGPGPADPLLAKQKHHHRRAFEYISKALKIDEENEGECNCTSGFKDKFCFVICRRQCCCYWEVPGNVAAITGKCRVLQGYPR